MMNKARTGHAVPEHSSIPIEASRDSFHLQDKGPILNQAAADKKFAHKVGDNPDIKVVDGKIHLSGQGKFKGKTVQTDLNASDFFNQ